MQLRTSLAVATYYLVALQEHFHYYLTLPFLEVSSSTGIELTVDMYMYVCQSNRTQHNTNTYYNQHY